MEWEGEEGGCAGVDYLAKSLNQILNKCTKITIFNCFSCKFVSLTAILQLSNVVSLGNVKIHDISYKSK